MCSMYMTYNVNVYVTLIKGKMHAVCISKINKGRMVISISYLQDFVGSCLATKFFIGNLPAMGRGWVIIKYRPMMNRGRLPTK